MTTKPNTKEVDFKKKPNCKLCGRRISHELSCPNMVFLDTSKDWEKEFNRRIDEDYKVREQYLPDSFWKGQPYDWYLDYDALKQFISSEIAEARKEAVAEIETMIFKDTDGVHVVMVWQIDKPRFDALKSKLKGGD